MDLNKKFFKMAEKYLVGGVNSPVRAFKFFGINPLYIKRGDGPYIYDENGKRYIDYCLAWGSLILGHSDRDVVDEIREVVKNGTGFGMNNKIEIEFSKIIFDAFPSIEKIRLTNSGTEAVMTAIRLARGYTKRDKIVKFEGSYHGHSDYLLVKSGSGSLTYNIKMSEGIPDNFISHTIVIPYNDFEIVEKTFKKYGNHIACIIVEPVMANCGLILPENNFLKFLREITEKYGSLLIFDEIITGFRISYGGAQEYFNVKPDITCLGKIIGAGLPVGAVGGKEKIMNLLSPSGNVYQAGTFSGNPVILSAGIVVLKKLRDKKIYEKLRERTLNLCEGIRNILEKYGIEYTINYLTSIFSIFFKRNVRNYRDAIMQDISIFKKFYLYCLNRGIYFSPSPFEANFLSISHTEREIEKTNEIIEDFFKRGKK